MVKIENELGIFFFRYYDAFLILCIDHKYGRIKKFVRIVICQLVKIEIELIYRYTDFRLTLGYFIANMQKLNVLDNYVIMLISITNLNL